MLILPPLFKDSPANPFLTAYYPDCVGMSPSGSTSNHSHAELRAEHCRAVPPQSKSIQGGERIHISTLVLYFTEKVVRPRAKEPVNRQVVNIHNKMGGSSPEC